MYAFFDGREDGTEFEGFHQKDGYSRATYQERVKKTTALMLSVFGDPDVFILEEVESADVLKDLLEAGLKTHGYQWFGLAQAKSGELSVGFISRQEPLGMGVHGLSESRLVLTLDFLLQGETVHVLGLHGRSRLTEEGEVMRKEEFSLLASLASEREDDLVILCGDFNSDPRSGGTDIAMERDAKGKNIPILITGDGGAAGGSTFFSPMADYGGALQGGTYFYDGEWQFLDNILIGSKGFDGRGWEYQGSRILNSGDSADYSGRPVRFDVSTGSGYSDHFALSATFVYD